MDRAAGPGQGQSAKWRSVREEREGVIGRLGGMAEVRTGNGERARALSHLSRARSSQRAISLPGRSIDGGSNARTFPSS